MVKYHRNLYIRVMIMNDDSNVFRSPEPIFTFSTTIDQIPVRWKGDQFYCALLVVSMYDYDYSLFIRICMF